MADLNNSPTNGNRKSVMSERQSIKSVKATEAKSSKMEMMKSCKDLAEKNPTMTQKLDLLQTWFVSKSEHKNKSIPMREVGELILEKQLANDIDSAMKIIYTHLDLS